MESENQVVLRRVITETKALDDTIALSQIRGMLYMYVHYLHMIFSPSCIGGCVFM